MVVIMSCRLTEVATACCLLGLHFHPEDGSSMFLQTVDELLSDYIPEDA
jgi:hypothetical protein